MRWLTSAAGMVLMAALLPAAAAAETGRPIERTPGVASAGELVTVSSQAPCEEPTGERHLFAAVGLWDPDTVDAESLAGAAVDNRGFLPAQYPGRFPDYTPWTNDGGGFDADGTWTAKLFVPYGTPPGEYELRAVCRADYVMGDEAEDLYTYDASPLTVLPWPEVPPVRTDLGPSGMIVDGEGTIHPWGYEYASTPPIEGDGWWPGQDLARGIAFRYFSNGMVPAGAGVVVDAYGGLHRFRQRAIAGELGEPHGAASWPGWDIARGVALTSLSIHDIARGGFGGGLVVDGWGGLHPFSLGDGVAPTVTPGTGPYWPGWDIARGVVVNPDGSGGYVLDAWGGLHGFGLNGHPAPPKPAWNPYWPGWDIARGVVALDLMEGGSGYILDAWGGVHPYSVNGAFLLPPVPGPYWPGQDIAKGIAVLAQG